MVLVDPAIPNQAALEERFAPLFKAKGRALQTTKQLQHCAAELRSGALKRGTPQFKQCTAAVAVPDVVPRLKAAMARLNADPERLLTQASTVESGGQHDTDISEISGLNHAASIPAAYASSSALPHRLQGSLPVDG